MSTAADIQERPILFSGPMVKAILEGRKTQTRRVMKPQPPTEIPADYYLDSYNHTQGWCWWTTDNRVVNSLPGVRCPWEVGMRLWVRETWNLMESVPETWQGGGYLDDWGGPIPKGRRPTNCLVGYRADSDCDGYDVKWRPSIFLPRWASRLTLEIVSVRCERLNSITEEDAVAEGFEASTLRWWQGFVRHPDGSRSGCEGGASPDGPPPPHFENPELQTMTTPARESFMWLWQELNGKRPGCSWASDPWVWRVEFSVIDGSNTP